MQCISSDYVCVISQEAWFPSVSLSGRQQVFLELAALRLVPHPHFRFVCFASQTVDPCFLLSSSTADESVIEGEGEE